MSSPFDVPSRSNQVFVTAGVRADKKRSLEFTASLVAICIVLLVGCYDEGTIAVPQSPVTGADSQHSADPPGSRSPDRQTLNAAFVVTETVFNSELMAPYDIFHHTKFRDSESHIVPFIVSPGGNSFTTFEGLTIDSHYSFESAPPIDILVLPSTDNSMSTDLEDAAYVDWLRKTSEAAKWVVTLCDGAFPIAATGLLDGRVATTFPGDRDRFAEMFPTIDVRYDVNFVVDGKFITSAGGALSYEPALYLVEKLYSRESAVITAQGLVLDWDLSAVPHFESAQ